MHEILKAKIVATVAHKAIGQKRKYSGDDYIVHPTRVVELVSNFTPNDNYVRRNYMIAAAWLHDVVEDTTITMHDLSMLDFSYGCLEIVQDLTKLIYPEDTLRKEKVKSECLRMRDMGPNSKVVKLADVIVNLEDFDFAIENDEAYAKMYFTEQKLKIRNLEVNFPNEFKYIMKYAKDRIKEIQNNYSL